MKGELLPLAVRAYARRSGETDKRTPNRHNDKATRRPRFLLVFDTETRTDLGQGLLFGCYRFYVLTWRPDGPTMACLEEGLLYADGMEVDDPEGYAILRDYVKNNRAAAVREPLGDLVPRHDLRLRSRADFVEQVYFRALVDGATVALFNAPFDLSRISVTWGEATAQGFKGGFSLTLFEKTRGDGATAEKAYRPRVLINPRDAKRAKLGISPARPGKKPGMAAANDPVLLDLSTLAYVFTGEHLKLEKACAAFGVGYEKRKVTYGVISPDFVTYCREDVEATANLYRALAAEYERWGLSRAPSGLSSPATLAKQCLSEAGVAPLRSRLAALDEELLGYAMVAYYGGRAECHIRRVSVPVVYLDYASMYPTVAALLGMWRFMVCASLETEEGDPAACAQWLAGLTAEKVLDKTLWPELCGFALVQPHGDVLPARAPYSGDAHGIGVNEIFSDEPLICDEPIWYTLPDLVHARLLGDKTPEILRAVYIRPKGTAKGLRPLSIRGSRPFDPAAEDVFRAMVEERRRFKAQDDEQSQRTAAGLKVVANSAAYGIAAELNRQAPQAEPSEVDVFGLAPFTAKVRAYERPGQYFYSPLAAIVTGAARLMLGLCETLVTRAGGSYAFCDTDSMAVVATEAGGLVPCPGGAERDAEGRDCLRALSWDEVEAIRLRFESLNPYDRNLVRGSILELEKENRDAAGNRRQLHCFAVSAKRYALYALDDRGEPELVKWSEHGLGGFYLAPLRTEEESRDWVRELWAVIVRKDALGLPVEKPSWLSHPALTRFTAGRPRLLEPFASFNEGRTYDQQVRPGNFLLVAHVAPGGHPPGADPKHFALVAPYESDPTLWATLHWRNLHDPKGPTYRLVSESIIDRRGRSFPDGVVGVKTYAHVLNSYRKHPESKFIGPDGRVCSTRTVGLLSRMPVQALYVDHVGKETNMLDEVQADLIGDEGDVLPTYSSGRRAVWQKFVVPALRAMRAEDVAAASGVPLRTVRYARAGRRPRKGQERAIVVAVAQIARRQLEGRDVRAPRADLAAIATFLVESTGVHAGRLCEGCGAELRGRQRRWCAVCAGDFRRRREVGVGSWFAHERSKFAHQA